MKTIKKIYFYLFFGLSFFFVHGQQIGNYISNGSFEEMTDCHSPYYIWKVTGWTSIDSLTWTGWPFSYCNNLVPNQYNTIYQLPRTGETFYGSTFHVSWGSPHERHYVKNRLKGNLQAGKTYCATFFVNIMGLSSNGNDGFGIYFGDNSIDTITYVNVPLSFLVPQVKCQQGFPVTDTLGWTAITGTFTATGNEKYAVIGIFAQTSQLIMPVINTTLALVYTDACIDDVSCFELNLKAYAGQDTTISLGDSVFIGRLPDYLIDKACIWYKLPNMTTAIDTVSGLWVKPSITSTYVVRQELDCSPVKWDTVVVTINTNLVGLDKLQKFADNINLFPNPTSGNLNISFSGSVHADIMQYSVVDNLGQIIHEEEINLKNSSFIVSTFDIADGLYQIHFKTQFGSVTKKFVKTN